MRKKSEVKSPPKPNQDHRGHFPPVAGPDLRAVRRRQDDACASNCSPRGPHMTRAITCTTRAPRARRKGRRGLLFSGRRSFLKRVQAGNFLEHATVYGNSYGILKSEVLGKLRQGKDVLLNVDVQGAATIRERAQEDPELKRALVTVFLTPPSVDIVEERLRKRGTDSPAVIQKRLGVARQEIAQWKNFDYLLISTSIAGRFAADAGDCGGGKDAGGARRRRSFET